MGVVRGSIPRESISFCCPCRVVVVVGAVVGVVVEFFLGPRWSRVDPLFTPRPDARVGGDSRLGGFIWKGMWRNVIFLWWV
jgi:hypothetical protein